MPIKQLQFNQEARDSIQKGINILADAVKVTLGAKGRNVAIEREYMTPQITKDGVTVAKSIELEDPFEDLGAQMIKEVSTKTNEDAGDGSSTSTVLAQSILNVGIKNVAAGANPIDLKRGIDKAVIQVVKSIKKQSKSIGDSNKKIQQIATVSANNDTQIGKLIADAMKAAGGDGVVTVESANGTEDKLKSVEGMQFTKGYLSPYLVTDNEKMESSLENPYILLTDRKLSVLKDLMPVLMEVQKAQRSLVIIAEDIEGEALQTLVMNHVRNGLKVNLIQAPEFGDTQKDYLEDIAILTGGTVISESKGLALLGTTLDMLGTCDKVVSTQSTTTIINGKGNDEKLKERISQIKGQLDNAEQTNTKIILKNRLGRISGGISIIYVGASSEVELNEKRDRIDDALSATRAAIEEGIIPGGGVAYIRSIKELESIKGDNEDEDTGIAIIARAIEEPLRQIVENGGKEGSVIVEKVRAGKDDYGYNARTNKYENLYESGVIDPTKVARVAIENAASIAGLILTTECSITNKANV